MWGGGGESQGNTDSTLAAIVWGISYKSLFPKLLNNHKLLNYQSLNYGDLLDRRLFLTHSRHRYEPLTYKITPTTYHRFTAIDRLLRLLLMANSNTAMIIHRSISLKGYPPSTYHTLRCHSPP